jgi:hypothetical protein
LKIQINTIDNAYDGYGLHLEWQSFATPFSFQPAREPGFLELIRLCAKYGKAQTFSLGLRRIGVGYRSMV